MNRIEYVYCAQCALICNYISFELFSFFQLYDKMVLK